MKRESNSHRDAFPLSDADEKSSATRFYNHPRWYDIIHHKGTWWEVNFLRKQAKSWVNTGHNQSSDQHWLEPACGTGRYLRQLAKFGYHLTGYDINPRSLQYARRKSHQSGLDIEYIQAGMTDFYRPGSFDFVFNTINTFRHLRTDEEALRHLELCALSLRAGGVYVLGLDIVDYDIPEPLEETWIVNQRGYEVTHFMVTIPPEREKRVERIINHITVRKGGREFQFESTYDLLTYDLQEWRALIDASPFEVVDCHDFSSEQIAIDHTTRDMNVTLRLK